MGRQEKFIELVLVLSSKGKRLKQAKEVRARSPTN